MNPIFLPLSYVLFYRYLYLNTCVCFKKLFKLDVIHRIVYPDDKFCLNNGAGYIEHNAAARLPAHFRLKLPTLKGDVDEFESSETVDAQSAGSKRDSLLLLVVFDIVHVLSGP